MYSYSLLYEYNYWLNLYLLVIPLYRYFTYPTDLTCDRHTSLGLQIPKRLDILIRTRDLKSNMALQFYKH